MKVLIYLMMLLCGFATGVNIVQGNIGGSIAFGVMTVFFIVLNVIEKER